MAVPHEVERHAQNLDAAATLLRRISDEPGSAEQALLDARTIMSVLAKVSATERWARRISQDILDDLCDQDIEAAAGGRR
jgi:hypothetical protein